MTDYNKLVKALRCKRDDCDGCDLAFLDNDEGWMCQYAAKDDDAAAAIEALQAEVERLKDSNEELREKQTYIDHYGDKWLTSAKDVPTAAYEHGYADGRDEAEAQLPKRGEWIVREVDIPGEIHPVAFRCMCSMCRNEYVFPRIPQYCPDCGSMNTEKMEVQDG